MPNCNYIHESYLYDNELNQASPNELLLTMAAPSS